MLYLPAQPPRGRRRRTDLQAVVDGVFYVLQNGCPWANLPKDFPPRSTVYFQCFSRDGAWARIHDALYVKCRELEGRELQPSAAIIDSQSVAVQPLTWLWSHSIRTCLQQAGGSPVMTGPIKWPRRCCNPKTYQTPYGGVSVERNVYQTSQGGKVFVPLEDKARSIRCATPRFARMLSSPSTGSGTAPRLGSGTSKYASLNASDVCDDLLNNPGSAGSPTTVERSAAVRCS